MTSKQSSSSSANSPPPTADSGKNVSSGGVFFPSSPVNSVVLTSSSNQVSTAPATEKHILRRKRSSFTEIFKILVVGAENVGKSAFVVRFLTKKFIGEYGQSSADCKYRHSEFMDNDRILIDLVDSCCREVPDTSTAFDNMKWCDGFIAIYSVTDRASFTYLENLISRIMECKRPGPVHLQLIGNKIDLDQKRVVDTSEGEELAKENDFLFKELSVAEDVQAVREAVLELCKEVAIHKPKSRSFLDKVFSNISGTASPSGNARK